MPRRVRVDGVVHVFPDDFTDAEVSQALDGGQSPSVMPADRPNETVRQAQLRGFKEGALGSFPARHPVETGALLGGLLTAPMTGGTSIPASLAIAGLGTAGGAGVGIGARQVMSGQPESAGDVVTEMAKQGAIGATGEGGGRIVSGVLGKGGRGLYQSAVRPSATLTDKYGDLVKAGLEETAPIGASQKVHSRMVASKAAANQMRQRAAQAGAQPIPAQTVIDELNPLLEKGATRAKIGEGWGEYQQVANKMADLRSQYPSGIGLMESGPMKAESDVLADAAQKQFARGNVSSNMTALERDAIRRGLKTGQETAVQQTTGENLGAQNAQTRKLYGLSRALRAAENRPPQRIDISQPGTWMTPTVKSYGGIIANQVGKGAQQPMSLALRAALMAALRGQP